MKRLIFLFLIALTYTSSCAGFSFFSKNPNKMTKEEATQFWQEKQIDNPDDPTINYNLGVALFKQKKYAEANANFDRAINKSTKSELRKRALFNQGDCYCANTLDMLGDDWEKKELDPQIIDTALKQINIAIDKFKRTLTFDKNHKRAKKNLKESEEIAKKLQKKMKQEQEKQDQKQEQDKQDQDKQKQDEQKQNDKQEQKKQDQDKNKQDQDKKEQNKKQEQDEQKQEKNKQEQQKQNEKKEQEQQAGKQEQQKQGQEKPQDKKQESLKTKNMRVRLENLQQDENNTQKKLMQMQSAQQQPQQSRGQKPW